MSLIKHILQVVVGWERRAGEWRVNENLSNLFSREGVFSK